MIARSKVIERSLSCFDWGMASLIPGLGIVCAPIAFTAFKFVVVETNDRWNPARRHLYAGVALALFGLLAHAIVGVVIYLKILRAAGDV
jgi:hypothetical protein